MTRAGIPSGCIKLSRTSIRGSPLRFDPRLRSVTPSASGMPHFTFAVSAPQSRIRRSIIATTDFRKWQDRRDFGERIYDREAIKERSRGLQRSGNPRNRSSSQKRIPKGCQKRLGLRTFWGVFAAQRSTGRWVTGQVWAEFKPQLGFTIPVVPSRHQRDMSASVALAGHRSLISASRMS